MNSIITHSPALSSIAFPAFTPTADERKQIQEIAAELDRIDGELAKVADLKAEIDRAGEAFAAGEITLPQAVALIALDSVEARNDAKLRLMRPLKQRAKATVCDAAAVVRRWFAHRIAHLANLAQTMEATERDAGDAVGIGADDWKPSPTLAALRESHRREVEASRFTEPTREHFRTLIAELAPDSPQAPSPRRKRQPAEQAEEVSTDDPAAELKADFH